MLMVLAALLLSIGIASAELNYILPDSNSRELTWDEVARWDYETLGYAFNEIFARHGYVFHPGEKYDNYFSCQPWYTPNRDTNNQRAVYPYLNATEWANYELIKEVRNYKAENGDSGESMWTYFSGGFDTLGGFDYVQLRTGTQVTYLTSFFNKSAWDYIETTVDGQTTRGFVPAGCLTIHGD